MIRRKEGKKYRGHRISLKLATNGQYDMTSDLLSERKIEGIFSMTLFRN